eukprot:NODE_1197_length_2076_cov_57.257040_g1008_i0.p1 GENE.NODE_1197_length_2076_cov_57.257040_g1008_i0~~NODE_1197_length_2076_cov_57.257040_g1008_i0.p1  ORF type:complete len:590 (-),score=142.68 NODE_1197_length_2076_cov_57.257040_g1008_i0:306-1898(-)
MERATAACFQAADDDLSGLVTRTEFTVAMRKWLPQELSRYVSDNELQSVFDRVDVDKSGFLAKSEFQPVVDGLFRLITGNERGGVDSSGVSVEHFLYPPEPENGEPWLGMAVRKPKGFPTLWVRDVAEGGPAWAGGLQDGDELTSFASTRTSGLSLKAFRKLCKDLRIGHPVNVQFNRGETPMVATITVGVRQKFDIPNVPPMNTVSDIEAILRDPVKLETVTQYSFQEADNDLSGLVTRNEFRKFLRAHLPEARHVPDTEINSLFDQMDIDESGYLAYSEFASLISLVLQAIVQHANPNSHQTHPPSQPHHPQPHHQEAPQKRPSLPAHQIHEHTHHPPPATQPRTDKAILPSSRTQINRPHQPPPPPVDNQLVPAPQYNTNYQVQAWQAPEQPQYDNYYSATVINPIPTLPITQYPEQVAAFYQKRIASTVPRAAYRPSYQQQLQKRVSVTPVAPRQSVTRSSSMYETSWTAHGPNGPHKVSVVMPRTTTRPRSIPQTYAQYPQTYVPQSASTSRVVGQRVYYVNPGQ